MRVKYTLTIIALAMLFAFGDAMINWVDAAPASVSAVAKHKKKKKKKKKKGVSKKEAATTTRTVVGYQSLVHEKTPEEIKHEQDSLAQVRAAFLASDTVYTDVEVKPEFPGGEEAMYEYINKNLQYPEDAFVNNIQGSVDCHLVVRKDGTITDVEAVSGAWQSLKDEAVRIIKTMPNWKPGQREGQEVSYRHRIRIMFLKTGNMSGQ